MSTKLPRLSKEMILVQGTGIEQTLYDIRRQVLLIRTEIRMIQSEGRTSIFRQPKQ